MSFSIEDKYLSNEHFKASYLRSKPYHDKKACKWRYILLYHNSHLYTYEGRSFKDSKHSYAQPSTSSYETEQACLSGL